MEKPSKLYIITIIGFDAEQHIFLSNYIGENVTKIIYNQ